MKSFINWLFGSAIDAFVKFCIFVSVVMMITLIFKGVMPNLIRIFKRKALMNPTKIWKK